MKKLIALVLVFCMAIILVPALAESADVAGEWVCSFAGHTIPLTINADGTFSMNGAEGTWISVINLFVGIFGGNFSIHSLIECIPPALMTWCASNVKKQSNL